MPVTRLDPEGYNGTLALDTMTDVRLEAHAYRLARVLPSSAQSRTFLNPLAMRSAYL